MKNIHVLPTDKSTRLFTSDSKLILAGYPKTIFKTGQNIYITSDEEIKEGDYVTNGKYVSQAINEWWTNFYIGNPELKADYWKIILTTDPDLIGVQAIDDEFLEWFIENPSCENVEVRQIEDELISSKNPKIRFNALQDLPSYLSAESMDSMILTYKYKIIFPKEKFKHIRVITESGSEIFFDENNNLVEEKPTQGILSTSYGCIIETKTQEITTITKIKSDLLENLIKLNERAIKESWKMKDVGTEFFKVFAYSDKPIF